MEEMDQQGRNEQPYQDKVVNKTYTCTYGTVYIYEKFKQQYNRIRRDIWKLQHLAQGTIADDCIRHKSVAKTPKEGQTIKKQSGCLNSLTNHYGKDEAKKQEDMEILELVLQSEFLTQNRDLNKRRRKEFQERMEGKRLKVSGNISTSIPVLSEDKENRMYEDQCVDINQLPCQGIPIIVNKKAELLHSSPIYNSSSPITPFGSSSSSTLNTPQNTRFFTGSPNGLKAKCQRSLISDKPEHIEKSNTIDMEFFKNLLGTYPQLNQILIDIAKGESQSVNLEENNSEEDKEAQRIATNIAAYQAIHIEHQASQSVFPELSKTSDSTKVSKQLSADYNGCKENVIFTTIQVSDTNTSIEEEHSGIVQCGLSSEMPAYIDSNENAIMSILQVPDTCLSDEQDHNGKVQGGLTTETDGYKGCNENVDISTPQVAYSGLSSENQQTRIELCGLTTESVTSNGFKENPPISAVQFHDTEISNERQERVIRQIALTTESVDDDPLSNVTDKTDAGHIMIAQKNVTRQGDADQLSNGSEKTEAGHTIVPQNNVTHQGEKDTVCEVTGNIEAEHIKLAQNKVTRPGYDDKVSDVIDNTEAGYITVAQNKLTPPESQSNNEEIQSIDTATNIEASTETQQAVETLLSLGKESPEVCSNLKRKISDISD